MRIKWFTGFLILLLCCLLKIPVSAEEPSKLLYQELKYKDNEIEIVVSGKVPENAALYVHKYNDVTYEGNDNNYYSDFGINLSITVGDKLWNPSNDNSVLDVCIVNGKDYINDADNFTCYYLGDNSKVSNARIVDNNIVFSTNSIGIYTFGNTEHSSLSQRTFVRRIGKYTITISGKMPDDASPVVEQVYNYNELENKIDDNDYNIELAFDIKIMSGSEEWQPVDYGEELTVTISNLDIETGEDEEIKVYRVIDEEQMDSLSEAAIENNVQEVEQMNSEVSDDNCIISFETDHFTTYTIGTIITDADTETDAYLCYGWQFAWQLKKLANPSLADATGADTTITDIIWVDTPFTSDCCLTYYGYGNGGTQTAEIYARLNGTAVELYTSAQRVYLNNVNSAGMFQNFRALQHVDLSKFDATSATSLAEMFMYDMNLQSVDFSQGDWDTSNVTSMQGMFHCCYSLESINFGDNFDTSNVTTMGWMFYNCRSLKNLSLGDKFDTSNVINARSMFESTWNLESLDFGNSNFCMSKATSLNKMFFEVGYYSYDGDNKLELTLPDTFNASSATDMSEMFRDAKFQHLKLGANFNAEKAININTMFNHTVVAYLDLGDNFNAISATDMSAMFSNTNGPTDITHLNLGANFGGNAAVDMSDMFSGLRVNILNLGDGFYTGSCTNMAGMFYGLRVYLNTFSLGEHFDTSNVTSMRSMFGDMTLPAGQHSINLGALFDTSNVTNFHYMFGGDSNLRTVDLGDKFYTANATNMSRMFYGCLHLKSIDWGEHIDTNKVTTFSNLFESCQNLTVLDLSQFTFSSNLVDDGAAIFNNTSSLRKIYAPKTIASGKGSALFTTTGTRWYLDINEDGIADSTTAYDAFISDVTEDSKIYILGAQVGATTKLCSGMEFSGLIKRLINSSASYSTADNTITDIRFVDTPFYSDVNVNAGSSYTPIYAEYNAENHTIDLYTLSDKIYANEACSYMFCNMKALSNCSMLSDILFDNVVNTSFMFANSGLTNLDLSGMSFPVCTTAERMFVGSSIATLNLSETKFPVLDDINAMFAGATAIKTLNMKNMSATGNATTSTDQFTFADCLALESIDLSGVNIPKVLSLNRMFANKSFLKTVNMDGASFTGVTTLIEMFNRAGAPTGLSVSIQNVDFANLTSTGNMFKQANLASIDLSEWSAPNLNNTTSMFTETRIVSLNLSNFDTSHVTNMGAMFNRTSSLKTLTLGNKFVTSSVENMSGMFQYCGAQELALDLRSFDTSSVTDMSGMFYHCGASSIDVSSFNVEKVTSMSSMFSGLTYCTSIDLSSFHPDAVTEMSAMFTNSVLTNINFGDNFDTSKCTKFGGFVAGCTALENIDLHSLVITSGANVAGMLEATANLKKVVAPKTIADNVTINLPVMGKSWYQDNNNDLITDSDTVYPAIVATTNKINTYIRSDIDGFMLKSAAYALLISGSHFNVAIRKLADPEITIEPSSVWEASSDNIITDIEFVTTPFDDTSEGVIKVSDDDSLIPVYCRINGSVIQLYTKAYKVMLNADSDYMFKGLEALTNLDTHLFDTSQVTNMHATFKGCSSLTSLDLSKFDTTNVTDMYSMFKGCSSLTSLDVSKFDTSNVTDMYEMFYGCSKLTSLDLSKFNTSSVTDMYGMFKGCSSLTSIDASHFETSSVTDISEMFKGCSKLKELDLSENNLLSLTKADDVFTGTGLLKIKSPNRIADGVTISLPNNGNWYIDDLAKFNKADTDDKQISLDCNTSHTYINSLYPNFKPATQVAMFYYGLNENVLLKSFVNPDLKQTVNEIDNAYDWYDKRDIVDNKITNIVWSDIPFDTSMDGVKSVGVERSGYEPIYGRAVKNPKHGDNAELDTYTIELYTEADIVYTNNCIDHLFNNFQALEHVDILSSKIVLNQNTITSDHIFRNDNSLIDVDLSRFDFTTFFKGYDKTCGYDRVPTLSGLFEECTSLTSINFGNANTSKIEDMYGMFIGCTSLQSVDLSTFDTSNVKNFSSMFAFCTSLEDIIGLSNFNTTSATNMTGMFNMCIKLDSIDASNFNTENVVKMTGMFAGCSSIKSLDISNMNLPNVEDMSYMFAYCTSLEEIKMPDAYVTNIYPYMFLFTPHLSKLYGLQNVNTIHNNSFALNTYIPKEFYNTQDDEFKYVVQQFSDVVTITDVGDYYYFQSVEPSSKVILQFPDYKQYKSDCWLNYDWASDNRAVCEYEVTTPAVVDLESAEMEVDVRSYVGQENIDVNVNKVNTLSSVVDNNKKLNLYLKTSDRDKSTSSLTGKYNLKDLVESEDNISYIAPVKEKDSDGIYNMHEKYIFNFIRESSPDLGEYGGSIGIEFSKDVGALNAG